MAITPDELLARIDDPGSNTFLGELASGRSSALSTSTQGEVARREAAGMFAERAAVSKARFATTPEFNPTKIAARESTRLDFAAVTAPHLLLEKRGATARGEGIVSKKR